MNWGRTLGMDISVKSVSAMRAAILAGLMILTAACGSGGSVRPESCPVAVTSTDGYVIGPGDILQIVVWRNEELSTEIPVRPDGRISTPLVDDMAAGRTRIRGHALADTLVCHLGHAEAGALSF